LNTAKNGCSTRPLLKNLGYAGGVQCPSGIAKPGVSISPNCDANNLSSQAFKKRTARVAGLIAASVWMKLTRLFRNTDLTLGDP